METTQRVLSKYEAYKDSGETWLGEIPEHWETKKLKFLGTIFSGIAGKKGDDFSKEFSDGMKPFIPFTNICNNHQIDLNGYQYVKIDLSENQNIVKKFDLLFLMSSETLDDIAKCAIYLGNDKELYLNSFCKGFRIASANTNAEYVNYLMKSSQYRNYFANAARGFTRINLKQEYINDIIVCIPTVFEQSVITAFLDEKTAKIDQAIAQKERLIELLKERKQILIQELVTGKKVWDEATQSWVKPKETVDSGVEWIGEIPKGWEVEKSQWLFKERKERARIEDEQLTSSQKFGVIPQSQYMELEGRRVTQVEFNREIQKHVEKGDFMISMRSFQGGIEFSTSQGCISSAYVPLIPSILIDSEFYKYLFKSQRYIEALQSTSNLVRDGQALRFENFKQVPLLKVAKDEQQRIASCLDAQIEKIHLSLEQQQSQIAQLKEYKAVLIDSAVTGKIKVPGV